MADFFHLPDVALSVNSVLLGWSLLLWLGLLLCSRGWLWLRLRWFYCMLLVSTRIIIVLPLALVILVVMSGRETTVEVLLIPRFVGVVLRSVSSW